MGVAGLLITICAAAPVFHWLRARGPVTWWHAAFSALLFANLPTTILLGLIFVNGRDSRLLAVDSAMIAVRVVLLSSGIGVASAGIFWWIATGGRSRLRSHQ